jgi:hypothetical protein
MKHHNQITLISAGMLLILLSLSCSRPPVNVDPRDGNIIFNGCRVAQTTSGNFTWQFTYNNSNDPLNVQASFVGTGSPNLVFTYNKKGQLIEYTGLYANGSFEFMHRYQYKNGRVAMDTTYTLGSYANPANSFSKRYSYLQYDELNRIVQDSEIHILPLTLTNVIRYQYDQNGNLVTGMSGGYDNKMNPHRTNKVWMLVDRNYSVNNPVMADTYNSSGLPLILHASGKFSLVMIFGYTYYYGSMDIVYDCH